VGVEPDRAAARVLEAGEDAEAGVAGPGEDNGELPAGDGAANEGRELPVDLGGGAGCVAEGCLSAGALNRDCDASLGEQVRSARLEQALRTAARRMSVVASVERDLD
jgi:hypothetical protein